MTKSMAPHHAIILAAGSGSRLGSLTVDHPKPLLDVAGETMLGRLIRQLTARDVTRLTIVVGHCAARIREAVPAAAGQASVDFIESADYASTNNAYSLWLARDALRSGALLAEADVVMDDRVLDTFLSNSAQTAWMVRPFLPKMDGALLEGAPGGPLRRLSIVRRGTVDVAPGFKSMGLLRLSPPYAASLAGWLDAEVASGRRDRYYDLVIADHLAESAPLLANCPEGFWTEVDTAEDLQQARDALERPS